VTSHFLPTARCDLHVHSRYSIDSGNYALRRARLPESFTDPERLYRVCKRRGMTFVTISDHNTLAGALRIAHLPDTFLSVEVTTRFPEDDVPLHVLVWNLTEEDHSDLQPYRPSVYELVAFLRARGLAHGLAHPLYRMGPPLTPSHVERLMLLFGVWEGRNGARPKESNVLACRLAAAATGLYLEKLAERHGIEPTHRGPIALTGGSDDHGALDIAATWTDAEVGSLEEFLCAVACGLAVPAGEHGSTQKLAHAVAGLFLNAYRASGRPLPQVLDGPVTALFDCDADDSGARHDQITAAAAGVARELVREAGGELGPDTIRSLGDRIGSLLLAGMLHAPYLATAYHHAGSRAGLREIESTFFGVPTKSIEPRALIFTDTFAEANGVAGTMRRLAAEAANGPLSARIVLAGDSATDDESIVTLAAELALPLPGYETIELRFPALTGALAAVEAERPDLIHVATPGPVGVCGLVCARLLGLTVVGSYHTELGPYALHLTRDLLVSEALERYVDWFYRQCDTVLAPTRAVAEALAARGYGGRLGVWGRGVDAKLFTPDRRSASLRSSLLGDEHALLLSVGRISPEKRLDVLLAAFDRLRSKGTSARLVIVGDGPARAQLEGSAPPGVEFVGEQRGETLAELYASADVFCFPSTTDTFGQVLIEAAASGLPVVAAAAGGAPEIVRNGRSGLLVPPDDSLAFADALGALVGDDELRRKLGRAGRVEALGRTWARSLIELQVAYRDALAGPAPRRSERAFVSGGSIG
jgi:glycosyltransferase involved in cell wall biosynthesis